MRKQLFQNAQRLFVTRSIEGANLSLEKFLRLEKHPRQKEQDQQPIFFTPWTFI